MRQIVAGYQSAFLTLHKGNRTLLVREQKVLTKQALSEIEILFYELLNDPGFPTLRVGSRMVVPKEKFIQWAEGQSGGAK